MSSKSSYEERQKKLQALFDDVSSPESSQDPYVDDGTFGSDQDYEPSDGESTSSEETTRALQSRQVNRNTSILPSDNSLSSAPSDADDNEDNKTSSQSEGNLENIDNIQFSAEPVNQIQPSFSVLTAEAREYAEYPDVSPRTSGVPNSINPTPRRPATPVINESWSNTVMTIPNFDFDSSACGITVNVDNMDKAID
ncbi:jg4529, partial [Pararge aegeria aegeria]